MPASECVRSGWAARIFRANGETAGDAGARSRSGEMARFKPGIGRLGAGTAVAVVPCFLEGVHGAFPPHRRCPRPGRVVLKIGEPLRFAGISNDSKGWRQVAAVVEKSVRELGGCAAAASGSE